MKNLVLQFALASTLALTAVAASTSAQAQNAGGRGAGPGAGGGNVLIKAFKPNRYYNREIKNTCECTVRSSSRNGSAATYKVCKKRIQIRDGSYIHRTCQPTG